MPPIADWKQAIAIASSEDELLDIVRSYCAQWPDSVIEALPEACRECMPGGTAEIAELAVTFTVAEMRHAGNSQTHDVLKDMASTFVAASERLRQLRPRIA